MTDNFKRYKEFIMLCGGLPEDNGGNLDKYYVIELMRRGKDNPDLSAANYHFRNYYVYSWRDIDRYEKEIKDVCSLLNLRAYCSVNYKLMSQVALDTVAECARRLSLHDYKKFYSVFESCSGKFVDRGNSYWVVDIDDVFRGGDNLLVRNAIDLIDRMESGYERNVVYVMPTRSGVHLITHPFNLERFRREWAEPVAFPDVKKNHLTLLYENLR